MTSIRFLTSIASVVLVSVASRMQAQPAPKPASTADTTTPATTRTAPPVMPRVFDRETVQNLIDNIVVSGNAPILKAGYFNPRKPQVLPMKEGYDLLVQAVAKEPKGTKRWFLLQQVRAWGGVRLDLMTRHRGLQVYESLFDQAALAKQNKANGVLLRTLYEYVQAVPTRYLGQSGLNTPLINKAMGKALKLYFDALLNNERVVFLPNWKAALSESMLMLSEEEFKLFLKIADDAAKNAKGNSRKRVLETKAAVYAAYKVIKETPVE